MTTPQEPRDPFSGDPQGGASGPASDPGQGGYGAPGGHPTAPGADSGQGYGGPTAYGAPQGYPPPGAYGGGTPSPFGQPGGPQLASWGSRVGATLIDFLIVLAIMVAGLVLGAVFGIVSDGLGGLVAVLGYVAALGFYFWQLWVQGETGQTIGKKQVGISLRREQDGGTVGGGLSIGRYFVHFVDAIPCYVGYLWPLWDDKKQTFADKILNTVVVKA
ncbi:MAG TPA: RDD family protein [Mycobacteriales bacterium]|nr:RDD family protein [Mycobacteriales bacterium]